MSITELHKDIGTSKDNKQSPIHNWYRFTAGFSYKLVDKIIELDKIYEYPAKKLFILIEPEDSYRYSRLKDLINFNK